MSDDAASVAPAAGLRERMTATRLSAVVIANFLVGIAATVAWARMSPEFIAGRAVGAITISQVLLVGSWVGLWGYQGRRSLGVIACGCLYLTALLWLGVSVRAGELPGPLEAVLPTFAVAAYNGVLQLICATAFASLRKRIGPMQWKDEPAALDTIVARRIPLRQLFAIIFAAAILSGLVRYARMSGRFDVPGLLYLVLLWFSAIISGLCAVWAVLSPGVPWRRIGITFAIALFLGACCPSMSCFGRCAGI